MKKLGRSLFCATICAVFVLALIAGAWTITQSPISVVAHGGVPPPPPWETNKDYDGSIIAHGGVPPPPPWETNTDSMSL